MRPGIAISAAAFLALAGCGSSPKTNYYALTPVVSAQPATGPIAAPVQLSALHLPPSLDRDEIVTAGPGQSMQVSDTDRWTAPLADMARNVLSEDLEKRLPPGSVILPDAPAPQNAGNIVVAIERFGLGRDGKVELKGSWSLTRTGAKEPALRREIAIEIDAGSGDGAAARGMSEALGALAGQIADGLAAFESGAKGSPPSPART